MRIVFFGTPDFALPSLRMLIERGYDIAGVFCQPDKPKGRGHKLQPPPVKELAIRHDIPVFQVQKISAEPEALEALKPDIMVSAAFGQIFSKRNLAAAPLGCVNVHASLLPKYRGAAPVQWTIINGEFKTGITTMFTDVGLDDGDIILQEQIYIFPDDTAGDVLARLALLGAEVLYETLKLIGQGKAPRIKQNDAEMSYYPMLKKSDGEIDFKMPFEKLHNFIRGMTPWPGAFTTYEGRQVKIFEIEQVEGAYDKPYGSIVSADGKDGLVTVCGDSLCRIKSLQLAGGKRMNDLDLLRGKRLSGRFGVIE